MPLPPGAFSATANTWNSGVEPYEFGLSQGWEGEKPDSSSFLFTERGIYKPGDEVFIKGVVRYRVLGNAAVAEKPDVLWDRPYLERLYARLEDEYELKERADALSRKLNVIAETTEIFTDIIDTRRSLRLEISVVILILVEVVVAIFQLAYGLRS